MPDYDEKISSRKRMNDSMYSELNAIINRNLELIKMIVEYVTDAYFIEPKDFEPALVPYYIKNKIRSGLSKERNKEIRHMVVSKEMLDLQLIEPNVPYLRLKRDDTFIVNCFNVYKYLLKRVVDLDLDIEKLDLDLLPVIYAIAGLKSKNISGINGYGYYRTIKKLLNFIDEKSIMNCYHNDVDGIAELFTNNEQMQDIIKSNYNAVSLKRQHDVYMTDEMKDFIKGELVNTQNTEGIYSINDDYLKDNPIIVDYLFEGVSHTNSIPELFREVGEK